MTYIRITFGRDRGHVKDFPFPEAQEMLARGQALPVDLEEPNALGYRELPRPETEVHLAEKQPEKQPSVVSSQPSAESETLTTPQMPPSPVRLPHRDGKKKR